MVKTPRPFEGSNKVECPNCGKSGWCLACPEGTGTRCNRPGAGTWGHLVKSGTGKDGTPYELRMAEPPAAPNSEAAKADARPAPLPVATSGECDRVYRRALELMPIPAAVAKTVAERRGLTTERLAELAFGYLPGRGKRRADVLETLEREFGRERLSKVPGFVAKGDKLDFALSGSGLIIPHRDRAGNVMALQVRLDRAPEGKSRYQWLSGAGGPSIGSACYLAGDPVAHGRVVLTEGAFKALAGAERFGTLAIGLPGASMLGLALPILRARGAKEVLLAYDADHAERKDGKPNHVFGWLRSAVTNLRAEGYTVSLLRWHRGLFVEGETPKGLDDAIQAGVELEELQGDQVDQHLREVAGLLGMSEASAAPSAPDQDDILAAVAALAEGYSGKDLQAALRAVGGQAKGLDAIDRACLLSDLQRELKRIKAPRPAELAKATLATAEDDEGDDGELRPTAPCDEEIDAPQVLAAVERYLTRYMGLPGGASTALALWVAHTYLIPRLTFSPRLAIQSPVKGCGKTTLMTLLGFAVEKPSPSAWPSTAALFREVEAYGPTLLLDEFDTWIADNEEIRGVINSGFFRPFAYVTRCEGDEHRVKRFRTFGAMALAGINKLPPTIQDRSIVVSLRKKTASDGVQRVQMTEALGAAAKLKPLLARLAADIGEELEQGVSSTDVPDALEDRPADLWRPLIAIADLVGGAWPAKARESAILLSGRDTAEDDDPGILLLQDVKEAFEARGVDAIRSESLLSDLHARAERPWREYSRGKPLSANRLGVILRGFGVASSKIRFGDRTFQGYRRAEFDDAFRRYIFFPAPPDQSGTPEHGTPKPYNQAVPACSGSQKCSGTLERLPEHGDHIRNISASTVLERSGSRSDVPEHKTEPEQVGTAQPSHSGKECSGVPLRPGGSEKKISGSGLRHLAYPPDGWEPPGDDEDGVHLDDLCQGLPL